MRTPILGPRKMPHQRPPVDSYEDPSPLKNKRAKKRASTAPRVVDPWTLRLMGKKSIFQMFYQGFKKGRFHQIVESGKNRMSEENLTELCEQLDEYVCLTAKYNVKRDGKIVMRPDGKPFKVSAKVKHKGSSKLVSIITKVCYEVDKTSIELFFKNEALREAWEKVSPKMRKEKPEFKDYFDNIDAIRFQVSHPRRKRL